MNKHWCIGTYFVSKIKRIKTKHIWQFGILVIPAADTKLTGSPFTVRYYANHVLTWCSFFAYHNMNVNKPLCKQLLKEFNSILLPNIPNLYDPRERQTSWSVKYRKLVIKTLSLKTVPPGKTMILALKAGSWHALIPEYRSINALSVLDAQLSWAT